MSAPLVAPTTVAVTVRERCYDTDLSCQVAHRLFGMSPDAADIPAYATNPALIFDIFAQVHTWASVQQRRFLDALYQETVYVMQEAGTLDSIDMDLLTTNWLFVLYLSPRAVCVAALATLEKRQEG